MSYFNFSVSARLFTSSARFCSPRIGEGMSGEFSVTEARRGGRSGQNWAGQENRQTATLGVVLIIHPTARLYEAPACSSVARLPATSGSRSVFLQAGSATFCRLCFCLVFRRKMDGAQVLKPYRQTTSPDNEPHFEYRWRPAGPRRLIGSFTRCPHLRRHTVVWLLLSRGRHELSVP